MKLTTILLASALMLSGCAEHTRYAIRTDIGTVHTNSALTGDYVWLATCNRGPLPRVPIINNATNMPQGTSKKRADTICHETME